MNYLEPALRLGVNVNAPSLDAAAHYGDAIRHAENLDRAQAEDVAAARWAVAALHAIAAIDFTPAVAAQIAAVLSAKVTLASWAHFDGVEDALADLDRASDVLAAVGRVG